MRPFISTAKELKSIAVGMDFFPNTRDASFEKDNCMKITSTILLFLISTFLFSQEIIEFRGVNRTGWYNESGLLEKWPENGPGIIKRIEGIGKGYSQPIFAEGKIFVTGIKEDTVDVLSAYNLMGQLLWETPYGRSWIRSYIDSRSTPTYQNGRLYVSSGTGQVSAVDAESGNIIWQENAIEKYGGEIYKHGDAESVLLAGNLVVYLTGGEKNTMVALNKNDGSLAWKTKSLGGAKSYASPTLIKHNDKFIVLAQTTDNLIGINPEDGKILWSYDLVQYHEKSQGRGAQTNPPLYYDGEIFVTSGYDHPGIMLKISDDGESVQLKWKNQDIDTHHGGVVLVDENLYGSNWQHNAKGRWVSVDWETGKTNWEEEWNNKGGIIYANEMLYLYDEKSGNVALVKPNPEKLEIVSSFKMDEGEGPHWSHPAIYNGMLFIRHGNVMMIYDIKEK